jgi:3-dehydroquinate synthetase
LKFDKKFESGNVRFIVTPRIGAAHVAMDVALDDIRDAIAQL